MNPLLGRLPALDEAEACAAAASGATVLCASRRLARHLKQVHDLTQRAQGRTVWPAADILPVGAWLRRAHESAGEAGGGALIGPLAESAVWERVLAADEALAGRVSNLRAMARSAGASWALAQAWGLGGRLGREAVSDDQAAFARWAQAFERTLHKRGALAEAQVPGRVATALRRGLLAVPSRLVLAGFDLVEPALAEVLEALESRGTTLERLVPAAANAMPRLVELPDAQAQWQAAARWARARLEAAPGARIAIVVPDLAACHEALRQVFSRVLPESAVGSVFNVSAAPPLAATPLADTLLAVLELAGGPLDLERVSALLLSPWLGDAIQESAARALLDARLRRAGEPRLTLTALRRAATQAACPRLARRLGAVLDWQAAHAGRRREPSAWVEPVFALLAAAGLPGEATLDSADWQTWERLREAIAQTAALDGWVPRLGFDEWRSRVGAVLADTSFQPEGSAAPVQVLGILEALPLAFDHLWLCGLTEAQWPGPARPDPWLPVTAQRAAGVPGATPQSQLAMAQRLLSRLAAAAPELVYSRPCREGDQELAPSALVAEVPRITLDELGLPPVSTAASLLAQAAPVLEAQIDAQAPPLAGTVLPGGSSALADQAACPFRAFARHRLGARALEAAQDGLDGRARGSLVHQTAALLWRQLQGSVGLAALDGAAIERLCAAAAAEAVAGLRRERDLSDAYARLEQQRLARLFVRWLAVERERAVAFTVERLEQDTEVSLAGHTLRLRPDRIDRLADGRLVVLDYKTGRDASLGWFGERPEAPQLPLYAVLADEPVAALAYARLRADEVRFVGVASQDGLLPQVAAWGERESQLHGAWDELPARWRIACEALVQAFAAGDAAVDPKQPRRTCEHCDLSLLCRIDQRLALVEEEDHELE